MNSNDGQHRHATGERYDILNKPLAGVRVLVTRPRLQAEGLCQLIEQQGGVACRFPALEISALTRPETIARRLNDIKEVDWLIFISANAVNFALNSIDGKIGQFSPSRIAAVGKATAKALQDKGLSVDLQPERGFNSEALLQTAAMRDVRGKRCLIVRGRGGREVLADTLRERGALVDYWEVYRREMPVNDHTDLVELLRQHRLDAITITSGEALRNLTAMLGELALLLFPVPLVVISERIGQMAETMGFERIAVSDGPADTAILKTLITLQRGKQWPK